MGEDKDTDKSCLERLKEDYKEIQEKYDLPEFDKLNEDFQIEKVAEIETDFLIREIRKFVAEKFSNYLRFIEMILNPVNCPIFVYSVIKTIGNDEKAKFIEIYKKLAKKEVELVELDISYDEDKEAGFIRDSYVVWQKIKEEMLEIIGVIKSNWDNRFEANGGRYFG